MSLTTPTTSSLTDSIISQLELSLAQSVPILPKSFIRVLAKVLAGTFVILYKYAGFIFLQMFVAYATIEETTVNGRRIRPLVELGRLIGVGDPIAATRAEHTVTVTVTNQTGEPLPSGSQLLRAETGVLYITTAAVNLDAATVTVTIRAASDQDGGGGEGEIGNLEVADVVSFANPLPNVARDAVVATEVTAGADAETTDAYRQRIIRRFQRKPQGGAYADYQAWAEGVAGVAHAYPYTGDPGEVNVYVEVTEALDADGIPDAGELAAVVAAIDLDSDGLASNRPANAAVNVLAITRTSFNVTVNGLDSGEMDTADMEAAIEEAVDEWLRSREPYIVGLTFGQRTDRITLAAVSGVIDDVVSANGGTFTSASISPAGPYSLGEGEKAKLGTLTIA